MKLWEKFSEEELRKIVQESNSYTQVCKKIGYKGGSGVSLVKEMIEKYHFDITHFTGQGWKKNKYDYSKFQSDTYMKNGRALPILIFKRGHQCERCKLTKWNDVNIPLEVHHKDGNRFNNKEENLELLCPNCHALTDNYRGKNIKKLPVSEECFVKALQENPNIRQALIQLNLTPKGGNYIRARELINKYNISHLL